MTNALDRVIAAPALVEVDEIDLAAPPARVWDAVRHGDLGDSPVVRALFAVRTLPDRAAGRLAGSPPLRIDDLVSSIARPGFQVLADDGASEVVVGAIGKVWHLEIPFVHVRDGGAFSAFDEPGFAKVAWAIRVSPLGDNDSRVVVELRVDATDNDAWSKFQRYFALVGPASRFVRRSVLASLGRRLGTPGAKEEERPQVGDDLLPDAAAQLTHGVTIHAPPEAIWPWLAATPGAEDGFEVLAIEPERALVLGGLYDADAKRQRAFDSPRPEHFWQVTWSFVLEPLDPATTRLHVRARAAFPANGRLRAEWIRPVHHLMETAQLRHLAARVEGRLPRDDWRDVLGGIGGAAIMAAAFLTPFMRGGRAHWGIDAELANRSYPGDTLVETPRWSWTHGIEIDAPAEDVWPWIAQLGADRGGFYSYQWLENLVGCGVSNAETVHTEWSLHDGDTLRLHPKMPPLRIEQLELGRFFVVHGPADEDARAAGKPWAAVSWLFYLEALAAGRSRLISRYRCASSEDLATRLSLGPTLVEPVGFAMDRRMLLGVKERVEAAAKKRAKRSFARRSGGASTASKAR